MVGLDTICADIDGFLPGCGIVGRAQAVYVD